MTRRRHTDRAYCVARRLRLSFPAVLVLFPTGCGESITGPGADEIAELPRALSAAKIEIVGANHRFPIRRPACMMTVLLPQPGLSVDTQRSGIAMKPRTRFPWAFLPVLSVVMACDSDDVDPVTDCISDPVSMQGSWEAHEASGIWWRFDLTEEDRTDVPGVSLTGTYATDYHSHLEAVDSPDTVAGTFTGGLLCVSLRGNEVSELGLHFEVDYLGGVEYCEFTGGTWYEGTTERVVGGLACTNDSGSRRVGLTLSRVGGQG